MNQAFDLNQLQKHYRLNEVNALGISYDKLTELLSNIHGQIIDETFEYSLTRHADLVLVKDYACKIVLRKLNYNISNIYKIEFPNRQFIISQLKNLFSETSPFYIVKTDIKRFYESINRNRILSKLYDDSFLSYHSLLMLKKLFEHPVLCESDGLPRGISISSTLSEMYLRKFDRWVRTYDGVYYYARFVDDIIVFFNTSGNAKKFVDHLDIKLNDLAEGLKINKSKTAIFDGITLKQDKRIQWNSKIAIDDLQYLGYSFRKESIKKNESKLIVSVSNKKMKRIKTRIVKSFMQYAKDNKFRNLENRIKFLSGNFPIKKSRFGNVLKSGIYYNWNQIDNSSCFEELNTFIRKLIFSNSFMYKNSIQLSSSQKRKLIKYCFVSGFDKKCHYSFSINDMVEIKKYW